MPPIGTAIETSTPALSLMWAEISLAKASELATYPGATLALR
jgi:hypothetical protein